MARQLPEEWRGDEPDKDPRRLLTPAGAKQHGLITQVREYELITPLFGGGAETQRTDPVAVVRASEVRGQLRFWWRATRGGQFGGNPEDMKKAEDLLWGSTSQPSLVDIEVEVDQSAEWYPLIPEHRNPNFRPLDMQNTPIPPAKMTDPATAWSLNGQSKFRNNQGQFRTLRGVGDPASRDSYVAFALKDQRGVLLEGVRFSLRITLPHKWPKNTSIQYAGTPLEEVAASLWSWETFGGVGARTRRGCGALQRIGVEPPVGELDTPLPNAPSNVATWLMTSLKKHIPPTTATRVSDVPHLIHRAEFALAKTHSRGLDAWRELTEALRRFRQQRPGNGQGRNRWPEPDAVRTYAATYFVDPANPVHTHKPGSGPVAFPRAALGLPINFQFKTDHVYVDPQAPVLQELPSPDPPGSNTLRACDEITFTNLHSIKLA
jgi:CRISPR-associated protein Cmr1